MEITIESLESLATELEHAEMLQRDRLLRMCRAYVRILAIREPGAFSRRACHYGDEAGHCDNSFPPDKEYSDHSGPRSIKICERTTEDIATSGGFYHSWRRVTTYGGLAVGRAGTWYRSDEHGTGEVGQYAAHPGNHNVDVDITWEAVQPGDLATAELVAAERTLRDLTFPLTAARAAES